LQDDVTILRQSTLYRAEYIDHPQQRQPHTWATYDYFGKEYLLYYGPFDKPRDPATIPDWEESSQDPEHPKFRPPLDVPDWYIAPRVDKTYDALQRVVIAALKLV
jgi:hypothetical protein